MLKHVFNTEKRHEKHVFNTEKRHEKHAFNTEKRHEKHVLNTEKRHACNTEKSMLQYRKETGYKLEKFHRQEQKEPWTQNSGSPWRWSVPERTAMKRQNMSGPTRAI
ncbi:unnamed protein product [Amoebophrya sp. A120]|nr:unnamed protein product [Amoebophrya sp. A120]|eukprot:GSA120T00000041001.1